MTYGTPTNEDPTPQAKRTSSVNLPTVLASAGVAAVVSAIIVTIGVVGLVISGDVGSDDTAAASTPTVVNLGAAQSGLAGTPAAGQAAATSAPAAAPAPTSAAAPQPAAEQVPASDGGAGSGAAPITPPVGAAPAPAPTQPQAPAPQPAAAPQPLSAGQLNTKIKVLMNTAASRAARADELQSGARGLGSVDAVANLLRVSGAGFTYQMIAPVTVNGTTLNATLQMTLAGQGSKTQPLSWVWTDGKWKLSNKSTCDVAGLALLPCSL